MVLELIQSGETFSVPLFTRLNKYQYRNKDSIESVIRYITRTRPDEDRANELIAYGSAAGCPYFKSPDEIIAEFKYISQGSYKTQGSLLVHYSIAISDFLFSRMNSSYQNLAASMVECCRYIHDLGYQSCFAIHVSQMHKLHVHLVISTTNFRTGKKLNQYPKSLKISLENPLTKIIMRYARAYGFFPPELSQI